MLKLVALIALLFCADSAFAAEPCGSAPLGLSVIAGTETVCHPYWASVFDPAIKEVRVATYRLTADQAVSGCGDRSNMGFAVDPLISPDDQARASDYEDIGYDLGHLVNAEDRGFDATEERSTFSMANVVPQLPGLNRQSWERGEDFTRVWAFQRGWVDVETGPIFSPNPQLTRPQKPKGNALPIPSAFFKVIYDPKANAVLAFEMPQQAVPKMHDLTPFIVPLAKVEQDAGFSLNIPADAVQATVAWPADLRAFEKEHTQTCAKVRAP